MATATHKPSKKSDPRKSTTEILPPKVAVSHKMVKKGKSCGRCA